MVCNLDANYVIKVIISNSSSKTETPGSSFTTPAPGPRLMASSSTSRRTPSSRRTPHISSTTPGMPTSSVVVGRLISVCLCHPLIHYCDILSSNYLRRETNVEKLHIKVSEAAWLRSQVLRLATHRIYPSSTHWLRSMKKAICLPSASLDS